jgi:hypothetical protein
MGAHNIEFDIPDGPRSDVIKAFKEQRESDRDYNGHQEGYSGDFQTVSDVKIHDKVFDSYNEAHEYCLDNAQKWDYVVAVKYKQSISNKQSLPKKILDIKNKIKNEIDMLQKLKTSIGEEVVNAKSKTIGCKNCDSKINRKFINKNSLSCPVCRSTLLSDTNQKRIKNKEDRIKSLQDNLKKEESKFLNKNNKLAKLRWLVAGWGAS